MIKIILLGKQGLLGQNLVKELSNLGQLFAFDRESLDLNDLQKLKTLVQRIRPQVLVNATGFTQVEQAHQALTAASYINSYIPKELALLMNEIEGLFVHYSTDYVFNGFKDSKISYTELDQPSAINLYGLTKQWGEREIQRHSRQYLIIRSSWLYGSHGNNFFNAIIAMILQKKELRVVTEEVAVPTPASWLAFKSVELIKTLYLQKPQEVFHVVPDGCASRYDFAKAIADYLDWDKIQPLLLDNWSTVVNRPKNSQLSNHKAKRVLASNFLSWQVLLQEELSQLCI